MKKVLLWTLLIILCSLVSQGCYNDKLDDPYDTVYNQMVFINNSSSLTDASASISGLSAKIDLNNLLGAPTSQGPVAAVALNTADSNKKALISFTNLKALENNAYYELWIADNSGAFPQNHISLGKFNIDPADNTIITFDNPSGLNPVDTNLTALTFEQLGIPAGKTYSFPIDMLNGNSGSNILLLTVEMPNDNDFSPSATLLMQAPVNSTNLTMSFNISFDTASGYSTITTEPAGIKNGTANFIFQNLPDISPNGFIYQIFAVKGGIYSAGAPFSSQGLAFTSVSTDFTEDLTSFNSLVITLEPVSDTSAANFPYQFASGAIVKNSVSNFENIGASYISSRFNAGTDLTESQEIIITIEPAGDNDSTPGAAQFLKGTINDLTSVNLALPGDFSGLTGTVSIGTMPGGAVNGNMTVKLVRLPEISDRGFRYECWLEKDNTMVSAGKFDSAGSAMTTSLTYNSKQSVLTNDKVIITIEPSSDSDNLNPFPCRILYLSLH
jgi:hypothetical protein